MATFNNCKKVSCVINFENQKEAPKVLGLETSRRLALLGKYYTILHDVFSENEKQDETIHRHLVLDMPVGYSSSAMIALLANIFECPQTLVSVEPAKNVKAAVRYLAHYDQEEKAQYRIDDIQTNDKKGLDGYFLDPSKITMKDLMAFNGDWVAFGHLYGPALALKYRKMIEDLGAYHKDETPYKEEFENLKSEFYNKMVRLRSLVGELEDCRLKSDILREIYKIIQECKER